MFGRNFLARRHDSFYPFGFIEIEPPERDTLAVNVLSLGNRRLAAIEETRKTNQRLRDAGFEVLYQGIRLTPAQIVSAAVHEDVNLVGLSVLSGSHLAAVPAVLDGLRAAGLADVPVVVGGIIPAADEAALRDAGVARVFTPKDFELTGIVDDLVTVVRQAAGLR